MSKQLSHDKILWKILEENLRANLRAGNPTLSQVTLMKVSEAIVLNWAMVPSSYETAEWVRRLRSHLPVFSKCSIQTIASAYKDGQKLLLNHDKLLMVQGATGYQTFKRSLIVPYPFIGDILSPIKNEISRLVEGPEGGEAADLRTVLQFLGGWTRIQVREFDFEDRMLRDYKDNEKHLGSLNIPEPLLFALNGIIKEWFKDFSEIPWNFKHGPGAVADYPGKTPLARKFNTLSTDPLLYYVTSELPPFGGGLINRVAEVVFVPKTLLTDRTICKEPTTLQYYQQGVRYSLQDYISHHPIMGRHIHINDQTHNRNAAYEGSIPGSHLGTSDLSSASDLVSWYLVRRMFTGTPLLKWFFATRSRAAKLPIGDILPLDKFAPMGSALCFPVECLVFAAICELTYRIDGRPGLRQYLVYGDDIVADTRVTNLLHELLSTCGFFVNQQKSFTRDSCYFRESCGGEYFKGEEVTPLKLPRNFAFFENRKTYKSHPVPSIWFAQRISLVNSTSERRMRVARSLLLDPLLSLPASLRPLFDDGSKGIKSPQPLNHHLRYFPHYDYQGITLRHGGVVTQKDEDWRDIGWVNIEEIKLFEWLRTSLHRDPATELSDADIRIDPLRPWVRSVSTTIT